MPVGPAQVLSSAYGLVTGRITSIALDPSDTSGNTLYVGTTGGGVWKSTNASGPAASVTFTPLTDTLPVFRANAGTGATASLSIGALAMANGVLLAGTGDPNDSSDSYFGSGLLRSTDGGLTWTLIQSSQDGVAGIHRFFGLSFAGLAFSTATPTLAVAAVSQATEGTLVNAPYATSSVMGLYFSTDAGQTWQMASVYDGSQVVQSAQKPSNNAATSVVWNPIRQRFYAAIRFHGYYESKDGQTWTRLIHQPAASLTQAACPTNTATSSCPIFRGVLAAQPTTGDLFALAVDSTNNDQGLYQDACNLTGSACASNTVLFANQLTSTPLETGNGITAIQQADYNLALAAVPSGTDTLLYAGTIDLYRCSLASGCQLRNTTNAANGCTNPAGVAPAQHAIAVLDALVFLGNDGGLYRSTDAVNEQAAPCSIDDASHFQNLNAGLGSLSEVVSFAQDPADPNTLLAGLGALGTAGTSYSPNTWPQLAPGEGGAVAIDPATPSLWYLSTAAGVSIARCSKGSACTAADFAGTPTISEAQVSNDPSAIDAPWLLDPSLPSNLVIGTCRIWRGPASSGSLWSSSNLLSRPFAAAAATACPSNLPVVRSLAAGGAVSAGTSAQNAGSEVLYAGLTGDPSSSGTSFGGHLFVTAAANLDSSSTVWTDAAASSVVNDPSGSGIFNPGQFDVSSIAVDPHDTTGHTVYATIMGFAGNNLSVTHLYQSTDAGSHWFNISSNLPNAPANSVVVDPNDANTIYVALDTGVYVTTQVTTCTSANCWSVYGTVLPNAPVIQLQAAVSMPTGDGRIGELRAATYGRGIWQVPLLTAISPAAPGLAVNPTSLVFASQQVGSTSAAQTVTVTNTGNAPLTISSIVPTGDFLETDNCTSTPIAQQATCSIQVTFLPTAAGARTGLLTVYGNAPGGQATVTLSGTATPAAAIVLTPTVLTFPSTTVAASSPVQNITISNTGGTIASLQSPVITGDFVISANTCTKSLGPQTGCTVSVTFTPTAPGTRTGALTVTDDAGTQTASLTGVGTSPATDTLTPLSLIFSPQQLNSSSLAQGLTLLNSGDVPLTLIAAQITSGDFSVVNSCGNSLNPHSSCSLTVVFTPKSLGQRSGTLVLSDQFRSQTVTLSGSGLAPPGVSLAPITPLVFAPTPVAAASASQTVTLTNNGGVPLSLASINVTGDFTIPANSNTCTATVAPSAVCAFQVAFAPTAPGPRTGLLTVTSNAPNSPQTLALSGSGVDFTLIAGSPSAQTIISGQTATYPLLLSSVAGVPGSVLFTCAGVPAHATCTVNPPNPALGSTSTITATVATGLFAAVAPPVFPWTANPVWLAVLIPCGMFLRKRRRVILLSLLLVTIAGCATGRTVPSAVTTNPTTPATPTPSGTYTLVVSASSAGLVRTANLTLTIQ